MSGISSLGVGSGLDLGNLVRQLVTAERAPAEGRLNRNAATLNGQLSGLGQVKSTLSKLDDALAKLSELAVARTVQVSDAKAFSATARADADLGSYSLEVFELARAQSLASQAFTDPDESLGAGELTLALGDNEPVTITLSADQDSLRDVRDAINTAEAGVSATLVRDGDAWRLLLSSEETGLANTISLSAGAGIDPRLSSAGAEGVAMYQTTAPADARFSVAGLELSSASNVVEDVLPGVTLTLKAATESPAELAVRQDEQSARKAIDAFVAAYNGVIEQAGKLSHYNPETQQGSALTGDVTLRAIRGALPAALGAPTGSNWNAVEMGVRSDLDGKVSLDADAFAARLAEDPEAVLASLRGFGDALGATVRRYSAADGLLDNRTESIKSSLKSISAQREALNLRMESVEARLRRQFGALDQMISQLQSTSNYLGAQLASIQNISAPRR